MGEEQITDGIFEEDEYKPDKKVLDWYNEELHTLEFHKYKTSYLAKDTKELDDKINVLKQKT